MPAQESAIECALCGRVTPPEFKEKHHLIPRSKKGTETIDVCCNCGDQVHKLFTNEQLAKTYHTVDALCKNPDMRKWIRWVRRQFGFAFSMKTKKQKR